MNQSPGRCLLLVLLSLIVTQAELLAQQPPYDVFPPAEPPYYRVRYEASTKLGELAFPVNYTVWIPGDVKTLRGVIVHQHGCGEGSCKSGLTGAYDLHWQALARKHGCALLAPAYEQPDKANCQLWCDPRNGSAVAFQKCLVDLGAKSGHPELARVPWALWGHSGGGHWAGGMALLHPERVAAAWLRSGVPLLKANPERATISPHPLPDAALKVPMMCNLGTKEGVTVKDGRFAGVWPANEAFFNEVRGKGGLIGVAVDPLSSHECGNQRYLAIPWLDACLTARLPRVAGNSLQPMPTEQAWLGPVLGGEAVPAAKYADSPLKAAWLPNETVARAWIEYVRDTRVTDTTPPPAPANLRVQGNRLTWQAEADLESGLASILVERDGQPLATVPKEGKNPFGRPVFQNLQYSDTPTQPLVPMQFTDTTAAPGKQHAYRLIAVNTVGLKSAPSAAATADAAPATRPNVIVVITDDQGYGDLSCHGNPVLKTPNLDRLHRQSVRLTDFHVCPMCTPTRGQLLTGVDCLRNGAMNVSSGRTLLRRGLPTMADAFAASGYRCGQFGKWHLGDNYPYRPHDRGFHESVFFPSSHIGSAPDFWENDYFDDTYVHNGKRERYSGYCTDVFFDQAMRWMKGCADRKEPFFCYVATNTPHGPLFVPARYREMYEKLGAKPNVARFFGMVANIDDNMGKLDEFLQARGLTDNTLLIFLTDNGATVGLPVHNAGMRGRKIDLYDGGHRVPCFICWPAGKLRQPGDVDGLTTVQDLLPTLIDLCPLTKPAQAVFDGISLAGLLQDANTRVPERTLVVQFSRMNEPAPRKGDACVLWNRWRLVEDRELYDLAADPAQANNLIAQRPDVARKLREHYEKWWSGIAAKVNEHEAIIVGSDAENPLLLSPADWEDSFLDQGAQVRSGLRRNGTWNVEVARAGAYEISLRRWAEESALPILAGRPAVKHADGTFPEGIALPIASARLKVGEFDAIRTVAADDKVVTYAVNLPPGRTRLQTWFLDAAGKEICGAYYVSVRRK